MTSIFNKAQIIGGNFQDPSGGPLSSGWLTFQLSHDANLSLLGSPTGSQVTAGTIVTAYLDINGNLRSGFYLWTNDLLTPSGSYYTVKAYNSQGLLVWNSPQTFYIQPYATSISIGTLTPTTP